MELVGQVISPLNGKEYFVINSRQRDDSYLCLLIPMKGPREFSVCEIRYDDGEPMYREYTGSDYDEVLKDLASTALGDMEKIRSRFKTQ